MNLEEQTLVQRVLNGEKREFGTIVNRYASALMMFVGRIVGDSEDACDVTQDTLVAAYSHLKDYDPRKASLYTWLQRIAYHEALYFLRRRKRLMGFHIDPGSEIPDQLPDNTTAERLERAIRKLPPEDQMLLQLYYYDDRSLKEIAYITGASDDTVTREASRLSSRLLRIRQRIRIILSNSDDE